MDEIKDTRLKMVRAQIGAENIPKKLLAKRCKVSRSQFSDFIHGVKEMPPEVWERLVVELNLQPYIERLGL